MSWQISLLIFYVLLGSLYLLQRQYSQKTSLPESVPPALGYLLGVTPLGLLVGFILPHHIHWSGHVILLLILEGSLIGLYNKLSFRAIRLISLAQYNTIYQSYEIVVITLGWVFLSEGLNVHQIVGAVLLLTGALFAARAPDKSSTGKKVINKKAVYLTLITALVMGTGLVAEKAALQYMTLGAYYIFGFLAQTLMITMLALFQIKKHKIVKIHLYDLKRSTIMGMLSCSVGFTYLYAIVHSNNISLITALSAFSLPLTVFAGYIILRERENLKLMWSAITLSCIGLIVTALH